MLSWWEVTVTLLLKIKRASLRTEAESGSKVISPSVKPPSTYQRKKSTQNNVWADKIWEERFMERKIESKSWLSHDRNMSHLLTKLSSEVESAFITHVGQHKLINCIAFPEKMGVFIKKWAVVTEDYAPHWNKKEPMPSILSWRILIAWWPKDSTIFIGQ